MQSRSRNCARSGRGAARGGFTLAELSIVTLIISLMAAVAVPRYITALKNYEVDAAANRIKLDLELARTAARKASASRSIVFDVAASSYTVASIIDPDHPAAAVYSVRLNRAPYQVTLSTASCGNDATLIFNGYGAPDSGATIVVRSGSATKTLTVDAMSGRTDIQ